MPSRVERFVASICGRNNGNEGKWLLPAIADAVHTTYGSDDHISSRDGQGRTRCLRLVIALTGENRPGVLPGRMNVGSDTLAWLDMPRDNHGLSSFRDHRPYWLIVGRLHENKSMKKAVATHGKSLA
jgi:hypothetical protein